MSHTFHTIQMYVCMYVLVHVWTIGHCASRRGLSHPYIAFLSARVRSSFSIVLSSDLFDFAHQMEFIPS